MKMRSNTACRTGLVVACALSLCDPVSAQSANDPPGEPSRVIEPVDGDSVQDIQGRVGLPASRVDLDRSVLGPMPDEPEPLLRREGDFIIDRAGVVRYDATQGVWLIDFTKPTFADAARVEPLPTMVLQPNQRLDTLRQLIELAGGHAEARVSGQVQVYRGMNYLLLTAIGGLTSAAAPEQPDETPASPPTTQPAPPTASPAPTSPMDLLRSMGQDRDPNADNRPKEEMSGQAFITPQPSASAPRGEGQTQPGSARREGDLLIQRAGRVVRSDDGRSVLFALEADGPQTQEPPLILLPSRLRATLEDIVTEQGDAVVFILSGRVYSYQSADYLLPTTLRVRPTGPNLLR